MAKCWRARPVAGGQGVAAGCDGEWLVDLWTTRCQRLMVFGWWAATGGQWPMANGQWHGVAAGCDGQWLVDQWATRRQRPVICCWWAATGGQWPMARGGGRAPRPMASGPVGGGQRVVNGPGLLLVGSGWRAMAKGQWPMANGQWGHRFVVRRRWLVTNDQWAAGNGQWPVAPTALGMLGGRRLAVRAHVYVCTCVRARLG